MSSHNLPEKWQKIMGALIDRRDKVVDAGLSEEARFFLGNTQIVLTKDSLSIGERTWKLPKKKK